MKSFLKKLLLLNNIFWGIFVFSLLSIFSCSDELLPTPESSESSSIVANSKEILAPTDLTATHGNVKTVTLNWKTSAGASKYKIYSALTPASDFTQIGEASGSENSFTYSEASGVSKYYKIKAVNSKNEESYFSKIVFGSTMATPIISIEMVADGTQAKVSWWMDNCNESTYASSVCYEVSAFSDEKGQNLVSSASSTGMDFEATITGLSPKTHYYFRVDAFLNSNQTVTESSDLLDMETARKLVPNKVENLEISEGESESEIQLSFALPEFCDVSIGKGVYERHPLYFKIQRKEKDALDSTYETLISYLGTMIEDSQISDNKVKINCSTNESSSDLITITKSDDENAETNSAYEEYISLSKITYKDLTATRGKQYTYRIQSYVDDSKKVITSNESIVEKDGWLIGIANLRVNGKYTLGEDDKYSSIEFVFSSTFENFGKEYKYILKITKYNLAETYETSETKVFNSISELNSFTESFTDLEKQEGYYKYSLYICTSEITDSKITFTNAPGKYIVTDDASKVPSIADFKVEDGFSDKFNLSWIINTSYKYTIKWNSVSQDGSTGEEESLELTDDYLENAVNNTTFTFSHQATSGDKRIYKLEASNGLTTQANPSNAASDYIFETLGTAKIILASKEYDSISFSWDKVQKATDYEIHAYYLGETSEIAESYSSSISENTYSCKIDKPLGYNDATKSGKDVVLKVIAKNTSTNAITESEVKSATLGPAATDVKVTGNQNDISIVWNKIDGIDSYLICRAIYKDSNATEIDKIDTILVDTNENDIKVAGESVNSSNTKRADFLQTSTTCTLKDNYQEVTDTSSAQTAYQINQSKIPWGLPFGYFVVPVKDASDFTFDSESFSMTGSKVSYSNISDVKGATSGYGLNITAEKAVNGKTQVIEWEAPYNSNKIPTLYRKSQGGNWEKINLVLSADSKKAEYNPIGDDVYKSFDYLVRYDSSSTNFTASYLTALENKKDTENSSTEQLNKGYLLSIPFSRNENTTQSSENYYAETISFDKWDTTERALQPESYEIYIKNLNHSLTKGGDWTKLATLDKDLTVTKFEDFTDTTISQTGTNIILKPTGISNGTSQNTDGILKVLRDGKHYYKIVPKCGENTAEFETYAYRQITDEELAKAAMLNFTYAFYLNDGGAKDLSNIDKQLKYGGEGTVVGAIGNASFSARSKATSELGLGKYKQYYTFTSYGANQLMPSGIYADSPIKISCDRKSAGIKGDADNYIYMFRDQHDINVENGDSLINKVDYSATLNFSCSGTNNLTLSITRNGNKKTLVDTNDNTIRKNWFPMQIHSDKSYEIKSTYYGWWEE